MKAEKIRELGDEELSNKVDDLQEEIFRTRIKKETGQLDQVGKLRELRKDLARVKTIQVQRRQQASAAEK